jgi:hypothetical protein
VLARINGREVECVIDTGASTSAITLDCLRRLNLDSLIDGTKTSYLNADGRITTAKGKVPNLVLSMGEFETLINPTVTSALNYNVLIGNDVLTRARAVIDYNQGKMVIQVDPTCSQEVDLQLMNPEDSHPCIAPLQSTQNAASECANVRDTALMMTNVDATNAPPYADKTPTIYRMLSDEYPATDYKWVQPAATPCLTAETAAQQPANMKEPRPPSSPKTAWSPTLLTLQEPPAAQFSNSPAAATPATKPPAEPRGMPPGTDPSSAVLSSDRPYERKKPATRVCTDRDESTTANEVPPALQNLQATNPDGQMDFDPVGDWHQLLRTLSAASQQSQAGHSTPALLPAAVTFTYALCAPSPLVINLPILGLRYINAAVLDPSHLNDTNPTSFELTNCQHLRLEGQAPVEEGVWRCAASIAP